MKKVTEKTSKGEITWLKMSPKDVWRIHRQCDKFCNFLPRLWERDGRKNPLLERLKVVHVEHWTVFFVLISVLLNMLPSALPVFPGWFGVPALLFCAACTVRISLVYDCRDAHGHSNGYALAVCELVNSLHESCAKEGKLLLLLEGMSEKCFREFIETCLVGYLVTVHENEEPSKDLPLKTKLEMLNRADTANGWFRRIADAAQKFGLAEIDFRRYHRLADELLAEQGHVVKAGVEKA